MAWLLGTTARYLVTGARIIKPAMPWPSPAIGVVCVDRAPTITSLLGPQWQHHGYGLQQACRGLCVSPCLWDKYAAQKEAFLKMLQESKESLKKLDKQIQSMLPAKEDAKDQLQKLGNQLATKMDTMSQGYQKEAKRLAGTAKTELEAAGKKLKKEADELRSKNQAVDATAETVSKASKAALAKATEINKQVEPIVKQHVDKAVGEAAKVAKKAQATTSKKGASALQKLSSLTEGMKTKMKKPSSDKAKQGAASFTAKLKTWLQSFMSKFKIFSKKASEKMKKEQKKVSQKMKDKKAQKGEKKKVEEQKEDKPE